MRPDQNSQLPWTQPGWLEHASAWIRAELQRQGLGASGPIEQPHVRPGSTVLRVPTSAGVLYFKATAPVLAHKPALTQALARWRPDCMPEVLAADLERGWMLLRDSGESLRSQIQTEQDIWRWHAVLPLYAGVQIELSSRLPDLLALGVLDRRLATLARQYQQLLADTDAMRIDQPDGLTTEEYARLQALAPRFAALCERLAGYRVPETLHHDDFHDGNKFVRDGRYVFADWGESCAAHPFFSLVVTLRSIAYRLGWADGAPQLARLRDSYLAPWACYEPHENLLAAFALAQRVGMVCRALTWHGVVSRLEEPFKSEHADAVPGWLQEFLAAETAA
jgi:Phosphotransferase enzyme family